MKLEKPFSIRLLTPQVQWLDSRRTAGISRGAVIRLLVDEAMKRQQQQQGQA